MNLKQKKIMNSLFGTILAVTALSQAIDRNFLAIFPFIGSIVFFINAWGMKNK